MTVPAESMASAAGHDARRRHGNGHQPAPNPAWIALIPAVVTLAVMLYQIGRPSLWQDEVSTLSDAERSLPALFRLLGHIDAVHGVYYLFMWVVIHAAGTSPVVLRLPSAVGMAVAAGVITLLGQRLVSTRAGLAAGLVFAALPQMSWYGEEARSYAIVTGLATIATYVFVRLLEAAPGTRRRWLVAYGASLSIMGLLNLFALLLVAAHGVALAAHFRRARGSGQPDAGPVSAGQFPGGAGAADRALTVGWLTAAVAAFVVVSPVAFMGWRQRGQIAWVRPPSGRTWLTLEAAIGPPALLSALLVITGAGIAVSALRGRGLLGAQWPGRLITLCVPWLILPPLVLILSSFIHPVYLQRYIIFCVPAAALLVGAGLAALGPMAGVLGLILIVALVLPAQAKARTPGSHFENLRLLSSILAKHSKPGESVLFANFYVRKVEVAYPSDFRSLRDIALGKTALQAGRPAGLNAPMPVVERRLTRVNLVWTIKIKSKHEALPPLGQMGFARVRRWNVQGYVLALYVRGAAVGR